MMDIKKEQNPFQITLEQLFNELKFSVRTYNICQANGLITLALLVNYYQVHNTFMKLKKGGKKTDLELSMVCQMYLALYEHTDYFKKKETNLIHPLLSALTDLHKEFLDNFVSIRFSKLSVRGQNALKKEYSGHINKEIIFNDFLLNDRKFLDIDKIGIKTLTELELFIIEVEKFAIEISEWEEKFLAVHNLIANLKMVFNIKQTIFFNPYIDALEKRDFSLFRFLNALFESDLLVDRSHVLILKHRFGFFEQATFLTLDEIGKNISLSRERIRQLSTKSESLLFNRLKVLIPLKNQIQLFVSYSIDISGDIFDITDAQTDEINKKENTTFSKKFIREVFALVFLEDYDCVSFDKNLNERIFIKKDLTNLFDFEAFITFISKQIKLNNVDIEIYVPQYIVLNIKSQDTSSFERIKVVCLNIINSYFKVAIEKINEKKAKKKQRILLSSAHILQEVLKKHGKPMKNQQLLDELNSIDAARFSHQSSIRTVVNQNKDIFVSFGHKSTYGLLQWVKEDENLKTGSIVKLVEDFLNASKQIVHILDITEYILVYYPTTNFKNISSNLLQNAVRFQYFGDGYWGLKRKNYVINKPTSIPRNFVKMVVEMIHQFPNNDETQIINKLALKHDLELNTVRYYILNTLYAKNQSINYLFVRSFFKNLKIYWINIESHKK